MQTRRSVRIRTKNAAEPVPNSPIPKFLPASANHEPQQSSITGKALRPSPASNRDTDLPANTGTRKLRSLLRKLSRTSPCHIHGRPVSFMKRSDEHRWRAWSAGRDFASKFYLTGDRNKNVWLAFMSTCSANPVGMTKAEIKKQWWHAWGFALIKDTQHGLWNALIYDCDAIVPQGSRSSLRQQQLVRAQRELLEQIRARHKKIKVWYSQDTTNKNQARCLTLTMDWIERMAKTDLMLTSGDDARLVGFIETPK